ncbi:cytochrome-c oxidase [Teredinibacter franksiae]|uniref:cytochrome-c oxidase n=1 Tax=Teredinibacter franksiae TaxID=2761453 RepID=UPI001625C248|nr:cytochrome-c oxidase [Teredinibacter franksiae]
MTTEKTGILFIRIASLYLLFGLGIGIYLGVTKDYSVVSAHAHVNLLGWMSMALCGFIYIRYASSICSIKARIHFWGHNLGLPIMMVSVVLLTKGQPLAAVGISIGSLVVVLSLILFTLNVFEGVEPAKVEL